MNYVAVPGMNKRYRVKNNPTFTKETIVNTVCEVHKVTLDQLVCKKRDRKYAYPRQIAIYIMIKYTRMSLKEIGMYFNRDHTTAIHSRETIEDLMDVDIEIKKDVQLIVSRVTQNCA